MAYIWLKCNRLSSSLHIVNLDSYR